MPVFSASTTTREWEDVLIPGSFEYHRPASLSEAVALLGRLDSDARLIAGGHSLIPMMKLRLAMPTHLVDLAGVAELKGVRVEGGEIVVGAMTTQHEIIMSGLLAEHAPILRETSEVIADPQVRYVGTVGGNVANGDPGNDMPAVMMALGATYVLRGPDGERRVPAREYYLALYETAAKPGEVLAAIRVPKPPPGHGWAYEKLKRKVGDYATAAAAVILTVAGGRIATCAIGLTNVAGTALLASDAAAAVVGSTLDKSALARAASAATAAASPTEDGRGSAEYRAKMAGVMTARALARAFARATS
jgi:carbon-monoxide dehydrogenase medium subunit